MASTPDDTPLTEENERLVKYAVELYKTGFVKFRTGEFPPGTSIGQKELHHESWLTKFKGDMWLFTFVAFPKPQPRGTTHDPRTPSPTTAPPAPADGDDPSN